MSKPIVTSPRRRPRQNPLHLVLTVVSALVLCAIVIVYAKLQSKVSMADRSSVAVPPSAASKGLVPQSTHSSFSSLNFSNSTELSPSHDSAPPHDLFVNDAEVVALREAANNTAVSESVSIPSLPIHDPEQKAKDRLLFDSNTERIISGLANTKRGFIPPPLFQLPMQENIIDILDRDIVIYDDDDERTVALKENCAALKHELKQYVADGGTAENFLAWYHNELTRDYNTWKDAQMYIVELMKQGFVEEADEYMAKANETLAEAKIRLVTIPDNLRKLGEKNRKKLEGEAR